MGTYRLGYIHRLNRQYAILAIFPILLCPRFNLLERLVDLLALIRQHSTIREFSAHGVTVLQCARLFVLEMRLCDLLVVLVDDFGGDAFHAEDFDLEALSAGVGILDVREIFFVHLVHVDGEAYSSC